MSTFTEKFPKLTAFFTGLYGEGKTSFTEVNDGKDYEISSEKIAALEKKTADQESSIDSLKSQLDAKTKDLEAKAKELADAQTKATELEGEVADLKKSIPGAGSTTAAKDEDDQADAGKDDLIDLNAEHNRTAAEMLKH